MRYLMLCVLLAGCSGKNGNGTTGTDAAPAPDPATFEEKVERHLKLTSKTPTRFKVVQWGPHMGQKEARELGKEAVPIGGETVAILQEATAILRVRYTQGVEKEERVSKEEEKKIRDDYFKDSRIPQKDKPWAGIPLEPVGGLKLTRSVWKSEEKDEVYAIIKGTVYPFGLPPGIAKDKWKEYLRFRIKEEK